MRRRPKVKHPHLPFAPACHRATAILVKRFPNSDSSELFRQNFLANSKKWEWVPSITFFLLLISTVLKWAILWILLVSNKTEKDLATKLLELFLSAPFLWAVLLFPRCEVERQETKIKLWMKSLSPRAHAVVTTYLLDSVSNPSWWVTFASWLKFYWKVNSDWNLSPDKFLVSVEWPTCCSP